MSRFALLLAFLAVLAASAAAHGQIKASVETAPLFDDEAGGDAGADDPAPPCTAARR